MLGRQLIKLPSFSVQFWLLSALIFAASPAAMSQTAASVHRGRIHGPAAPGAGPGQTGIGHTSAGSPLIAVTTQAYNNYRTNANLSETILNTSNVNPTSFGKLFTVNLDGEEYAEPLYVPQLSVTDNSGNSLGVHNVVFAATMNDSLYAIDADNGAILWQRNYGPAMPAADVEPLYTDIDDIIGIEGTPVIDLATNTIYFVSRNKMPDGSYPQYLNAADIRTGAPKFNSPMLITANYANSSGTVISFYSMRENQRPALTLANGNIYIAWASHTDYPGATNKTVPPYHGWVIAYSAANLSQVAAYCNTADGSQGGIWQAGQGLTVDPSGNVYFSSGNGTTYTTSPPADTGSSFVKMTPTLGLTDWFTPQNYGSLNSNDTDLGSAGLLAVPGTTFLISGGKQGLLYVVNTNNMGQYVDSHVGPDNVVQEFGAVASQIRSSPVYYVDPVNGPTIYLWGPTDYLKAYQFNTTTGLFTTTPVHTGTIHPPSPGGFLTISSNNGAAGSNILWASAPYKESASQHSVQGVLYAYNATNLAPLWSDKTNDSRDEVGDFSKFCNPVVANGKLYVATFGTQLPYPGSNGKTVYPSGNGALEVYGLLTVAPGAPTSLAAAAGNNQVGLSWNNGGGDVATYNLYRSLTAGGEGATPYKTGLTGTTYTDTQVANGLTYYYQVTAVNQYGESPKSNEASATPASPSGLLSQGLATSAYTASSIETDKNGNPYPQFSPQYAFDGDTTTRWSSAYVDPTWVQVDLGASDSITDIKLDWEHAAGQNYLLQVSNDGTSWTTVATVTNNIGPAVNGNEALDYPNLNATGRYVRMYGTARVTQYGYSLYEFQVYGYAPAGAPTIASLSPATAVAGSVGFPLTIAGTGFSAATTVQFGSDTLTPDPNTLVSTSMTVNVPAADIATPGAKAITLTNPNPGGGSSASTFTVTPAPTTISGKVSLQWVAAGSLNQPLVFTLTPTGATGGNATTLNITPSATDGSYSLANIPAGTYTLGIKGSKWLRTDISVDTTGGNVTTANVALLGGDANGDNSVNTQDLTILQAAYGSKAGDSKYNAAADFSCDGAVNALDFNILRANNGKTGDN